MVERNRVRLELDAIPENVGVARLVAAMLAAQADFTMAEVDEVKLAVSEAVTNAIIHGYSGQAGHVVRLEAAITAGALEIAVSDTGKGIADIAMAMQPAVSSDPDRMGLGFCFMESHMDTLQVESAVGAGTKVVMTKRPGSKPLAQAAN